MKEIEHFPNEKRPDNRIWWVIWPLLALGWVGVGYSFGFDWRQIALGGFSGLVLATWAIEITGNETPPSWRRKPPRAR